MRYRIVHRTSYGYASPVHESFNEVRLQPTSGQSQTCLDFELTIDPPATVVTFRDYYGNAVHDFGVPYLHDHLIIEAASEVITFASASEPLGGPGDDEADASPPLSAVATDPLVSDDWAEFLSPSAYVALEAASGDLARAILAQDPETTAYLFLLRACGYIRDNFTYRVGATNVHSTVAELIAGGSGVCQDYAHLLIALCRHVGLPARYVSGYLGGVTESEASHAWSEVFVPPYGWLGMDPTLGTRCTGRHVQIGFGRDYADVPPLRGTYRGGGEAELSVTVRGETLGDTRTLVANTAAANERGRGRLIQYQQLGAAAQLQRLGAMTQTLGAMTQTLGMTPGEFFEMPRQSDEAEVPRQQPQQQQQCGESRFVL